MEPTKPPLALVPRNRPHHPPVQYNGTTYDPTCEQFVHMNSRGEYLYFEHEGGYFIVRDVGGCMVGRPGRTLETFGSRYTAIPLAPNLL